MTAALRGRPQAVAFAVLLGLAGAASVAALVLRRPAPATRVQSGSSRVQRLQGRITAVDDSARTIQVDAYIEWFPRRGPVRRTLRVAVPEGTRMLPPPTGFGDLQTGRDVELQLTTDGEGDLHVEELVLLETD